jgi:hypothetical protein
VFTKGILLPLTTETCENEARLASYLGVVVHEFSHQCLMLLPRERRQSFSDRVLYPQGILNLYHPNIVEEAIHTAIGNLLFLRRHLPEALDDRMVYRYELENAYPYAIDALARTLEPLVEGWLSGQCRFSEVVDAALLEQLRLFGARPSHHAAVALVWAADRGGLGYLRNTFPALRRWTFGPNNKREFIDHSRRNPRISRWILLHPAERLPTVSEELSLAHLLPLAPPEQKRDSSAWCIAARRQKDSGYDFLLVAPDADGMRRLVMTVHQASTIPEGRCLHVAA